MLISTDRNSAYDYWVADLSPPSYGPSRANISSVIVKAGYLIRTARLEDDILDLTGDANATSSLEVIGSPSSINSITWNDKPLSSSGNEVLGTVTAALEFSQPSPNLPDLAGLDWKVFDSLPELQAIYDDSKWTPATLSYTNNTTVRNLTTPTSLYSSDYGYNTGSLLYRGHFVANGAENNISVHTQGGTGYGTSIWLNDTFLSSWVGNGGVGNVSQNKTLADLEADQPYVVTVLIDHMGYDESGPIGSDTVRFTFCRAQILTTILIMLPDEKSSRDPGLLYRWSQRHGYQLAAHRQSRRRRLQGPHSWALE